ncbi:MAG: sigma-70 family RNA polymerase sigma factor [Planctomycetaceae bacterium]
MLRRTAAGDDDAIGTLLDRQRGRLLRMIAVRMDPRLAARLDPSDIVQEVLIEAAGRLPDFARSRPLPLYRWLRQLGFDRLVELHRRHVRTQKRAVGRETVPLPDRSSILLANRLIDTGTGPGGKLLRKELRERVRAALDLLDPDDREILVMRHIEQLSVAEIAALLGVSQGAVKMRRLRAIERLRKVLDRGEHDG